MLPGVYFASKKNGATYYRASITYHGKHISLGSFQTELHANKAYLLAGKILSEDVNLAFEDYHPEGILSFHKWVVLHNLKMNKIYFKNPIYLRSKYFLYYLDKNTALKFDVDDLFYYAHHKILRRGGHLFVTDYGMQVNLLSRYGIINYAVAGRDYLFVNGDETDFRYGNIKLINHYHGVFQVLRKGRPEYLAKIHINGDYQIGRYRTEAEAAIAYNKAVAILRDHGFHKRYTLNYIDGVDEIAYASMYQRIRISRKLFTFAETHSVQANQYPLP